MRIESNELHTLDGAVRIPPVHELHDLLLRRQHARRRQRLIELALRHRHADFEVIHVLRHDPEIGPRVVDDVGGRLREPDEQADLDGHQDDGEHDAHHRDREAHLVVQEIADRE